MKSGRGFLVVLLAVALLAGACAGPAGLRTQQGTLLGGALGAMGGAIVGGGHGAALGAAIGGGVGALAGAYIGTQEQAAAYVQPPPLYVLKGKRVAVVRHPDYGHYSFNAIKPVVEQQLMLRGAGEIYDLPQYYQGGQPRGVELYAQISAEERYGSVAVALRLIDPATSRVVAYGPGSREFGYYSGYGGDMRTATAQAAAKEAVWNLQPF